MANVSDAYGTIVVAAKDLKKIRKELITWVTHFGISGYYGIVWHDLDSEKIQYALDNNIDLSFNFQAAGRWTFSSTLQGYAFDVFGGDDVARNLAKALYETDTALEIEYVDCEPGFAILYEADGIIKGILNEEGYSLTCVEMNCQMYEYTAKNLIALYFIDEYFDITDEDDCDRLMTEVQNNIKNNSNDLMSLILKCIDEDDFLKDGLIPCGEIYRIVDTIENRIVA